MKKIALLIVLIFTNSIVFSSSDHEIVEPYCKAFQEIGGLVMKYRQSKLSLKSKHVFFSELV